MVESTLGGCSSQSSVTTESSPLQLLMSAKIDCQSHIGSVLKQAIGILFLKLTKTHRQCLPLQILPAQSQLDEWQNHCEFNCRQLSFEITNHHIKFKLGSFGSYMIMMMTQ